jgi:CubicO group peptidase (beta-lactamase class C family)
LFHGDPADRATLIHRIGLVRPTKPFRTTFQYNNILYVAAGEAAARAAGTTWEELIQSRIFQPLAMTRANFHVAEAERALDHATPHARGDGDEPRPVAWRDEDNGGPAGSINANARDLARWLRFQLGDGTFEGRRLLSAVRLAETHSPHVPIPLNGPDARYKMTRDTELLGYGLGWMIQEYRGHLVVFHGGTVRGFRTQVAILPRDNLALVVLANRSPTPFPNAVRNSLIDRLLGLPPVDWNADYAERGRLADVARKEAEARIEGQRRPDTRPSLPLAEYTGTYRDAAYGPARVFLRDGSLHVAWGPLEAKLQHYHHDTFRANGALHLDGELATFVLGASGQVERLLLLGQEWSR